jgi:hypothetical protein
MLEVSEIGISTCRLPNGPIFLCSLQHPIRWGLFNLGYRGQEKPQSAKVPEITERLCSNVLHPFPTLVAHPQLDVAREEHGYGDISLAGTPKSLAIL